MIQFKVKITEQDYRRLNFILMYRRPATIFITLVGVLQAVLLVLGLVFNIRLAESLPVSAIFMVVFLVLPVLSVSISSRRIYKSNKYLQEEISWTIDDTHIHLLAGSFKGDYEWNNIYRIKEFKHWILIYKDRMVVNIIPKSALSPNDIAKFWALAAAHNIKR